MKPIKTFLLLLLLGICCITASAEVENVRCESSAATYTLKADKSGKLASVKVTERQTFTADDFDDEFIALTSYGDGINIDKASAPGAKPQYIQHIDEGIFYEDSRLCIMKVKVKKGAKANVEFARTFTDPVQFCRIPLMVPYKTDVETVTVNVPVALADKIVLTPFNMPESAKTSRTVGANGDVTYEYRLSDLKPYKKEILAPASVNTAPAILVTGYFEDIQALYDYFHSFVDNETPDDAVTALARQLTEGLTDPVDKINAIAAWVRNNIRYIAIEHGELGTRPDKAAAVLANKYGDCKGSANLIKAMLKAAGLDGRLVWIGTAEQKPYTWEEFTAIGAGNHMIAACVLPDSIVYVDGTVQYAPAGYLPAQLRGRQALIEDGGSYMLRTVPQMPDGYDLDRFEAEYTVTPDMLLEGDIRHTYTGRFASMYNNLYHTTETSKRERIMHILAAQGKKSAQASDLTFANEGPAPVEVCLNAHISDHKAVNKANDMLYLSLAVIDLDCGENIDPAERVNPVRIPAPFTQTAHITVRAADGLTLAEQPKDAVIDTSWYTGSVRYSIADGCLTIDARIDTRRLDASVGEIAEWNSAIKAIRKAFNPVIKLTKPQ